MDERELEQAIRDYIMDLYKACYIGWLRVEKLNPGYKMSIGIPSYMYPTTTAGDWETDEDFLNYIFEDLRTRNYMRVWFYKVYRTSRSEEEGRTNEQPGVPDKPSCEPNYKYYEGISPID